VRKQETSKASQHPPCSRHFSFYRPRQRLPAIFLVNDAFRHSMVRPSAVFHRPTSEIACQGKTCQKQSKKRQKCFTDTELRLPTQERSFWADTPCKLDAADEGEDSVEKMNCAEEIVLAASLVLVRPRFRASGTGDVFKRLEPTSAHGCPPCLISVCATDFRVSRPNSVAGRVCLLISVAKPLLPKKTAGVRDSRRPSFRELSRHVLNG